MDRKHSVLAASGISVVLVAGSTAFAFASGIFVGKPVTRVGNFQAMQARLVPAAKPAPTSPVAGAPPREPAAVHVLPAAAVATRAQIAVPVTTRRPSAPRYAVVRPATTHAISHSGPSAVSSIHDDDRGEHDAADTHESAREIDRDD